MFVPITSPVMNVTTSTSRPTLSRWNHDEVVEPQPGQWGALQCILCPQYRHSCMFQSPIGGAAAILAYGSNAEVSP